MLKVRMTLTMTAHTLWWQTKKVPSKGNVSNIKQRRKRHTTVKPGRPYKQRLAVRWIYMEHIAQKCKRGVPKSGCEGRKYRGWEEVLSERHLHTQQHPATTQKHNQAVDSAGWPSPRLLPFYEAQPTDPSASKPIAVSETKSSVSTHAKRESK